MAKEKTRDTKTHRDLLASLRELGEVIGKFEKVEKEETKEVKDGRKD